MKKIGGNTFALFQIKVEGKGTLNKQPKETFEFSKTQIETTINDSFDITQGFIPDDL